MYKQPQPGDEKEVSIAAAMQRIASSAVSHVTDEQYANAVKSLLQIANRDTSGSRIAALVLLSAYNSYSFAVPVADLGLLDDQYFEHAMTVIRARAELRIEPHEVIDNGGLEFDVLWAQWSHYDMKKLELPVVPAKPHLIDDTIYDESEEQAWLG